MYSPHAVFLSHVRGCSTATVTKYYCYNLHNLFILAVNYFVPISVHCTDDCLLWCSYVLSFMLFYAFQVKLAKNTLTSPCKTLHHNGFVNDSETLQSEDVFEGISSPKCRSVTRNGLLKLQKCPTVSAVNGNLTYCLILKKSEHICAVCRVEK